MHEGHREKLRKRLQDSGDAAFADHELLELFLTYAIPRKDVNPLAHTLINTFGSFSAVMSAEFMELKSIKGMGESSATLFLLFRALSRRFQLSSFKSSTVIKTSRAAASYASKLLNERVSGRRVEAFYCIFLDAHNRLLHSQLISEGTPNETSVQPRIVVEAALLHKASSVILAHNHPSGDIRPSSDDITLTKSLHDIFAKIGISLHEHIIVGHSVAYAMYVDREYGVDNLQEVSMNEPDIKNDANELLQQIRAMDSESLSILLDGLFDLKTELDADS